MRVAVVAEGDDLALERARDGDRPGAVMVEPTGREGDAVGEVGHRPRGPACPAGVVAIARDVSMTRPFRPPTAIGGVTDWAWLSAVGEAAAADGVVGRGRPRVGAHPRRTVHGQGRRREGIGLRVARIDRRDEVVPGVEGGRRELRDVIDQGGRAEHGRAVEEERRRPTVSRRPERPRRRGSRR